MVCFILPPAGGALGVWPVAPQLWAVAAGKAGPLPAGQLVSTHRWPSMASMAPELMCLLSPSRVRGLPQHGAQVLSCIVSLSGSVRGVKDAQFPGDQRHSCIVCCTRQGSASRCFGSCGQEKARVCEHFLWFAEASPHGGLAVTQTEEEACPFTFRMNPQLDVIRVLSLIAVSGHLSAAHDFMDL